MKLYKVLIVDDHPLIVDAYIRSLRQVARTDTKYRFSIDTANNCDIAMLKIKDSIKSKDPYRLVFLDVRVPRSSDNKILGGEDLSSILRSKSKKTKVIVSTSFNDSYLISCILKDIDPEACLIKNDLTVGVLIDAIKSVLIEPPYYSRSVMKIFRKQSASDVVIDHIDRKILHELSNGTRMSELPKILHLSLAALERRKRLLKDVFNVKGRGDRDLIKLAHEKGFI